MLSTCYLIRNGKSLDVVASTSSPPRHLIMACCSIAAWTCLWEAIIPRGVVWQRQVLFISSALSNRKKKKNHKETNWNKKLIPSQVCKRGAGGNLWEGICGSPGTKIHISKRGNLFLVPLMWIRYSRQDPSTDWANLHRHYPRGGQVENQNVNLACMSEQSDHGAGWDSFC